MKLSHLAFLLCVLPVMIGIADRGAEAASADFRFERALTLPEGEPPRISLGISEPRTLLFTEKIPTRSGAPAIVVVRMHEVWYFDSADLSLIHENTYGERELVCVSNDGAFIAVYVSTSDPIMHETLHWLRVETWEGNEVWRKSINLSRSGGFEPTITGGLVVYPSAGISSDPSPVGDWRSVPPALPNGLMILGASGELLLENPVWGRLALADETAVSEDGRCLAFAYSRTEAERTDPSELILYGDEGCVALYDLAAGEQLWARCFDNVLLSDLALDGSAKHIVCFAASLEQRLPNLHSSVLLAFDRQGRQPASRSLAEPEEFFSTRGPVFSPDGGHCAFTATINHFDESKSMKVYVFGTSDWEVESEFLLPERFDYMACRMVTDQGCAVVTAKRAIPRGAENHLFFVSGGHLIQDVDLRTFGNGEAASRVFMPVSENSIWLLQGESLSKYVIEGNPCSQY